MKKIVHSMNFVFDASKHYQGVDPERVSQTVPGHDLSIKDLLTRYVTGRPLPQMNVPHYDGEGEESYYDFSKMDKLEQLDFKRELEASINADSAKLDATQKRIKDKMAAKKAAEKEDKDRGKDDAGIATT